MALRTWAWPSVARTLPPEVTIDQSLTGALELLMTVTEPAEATVARAAMRAALENILNVVVLMIVYQRLVDGVGDT